MASPGTRPSDSFVELETAPWSSSGVPVPARAPTAPSPASSTFSPGHSRVRARSRAVNQVDFRFALELRGRSVPQPPKPFSGTPRPSTYVDLVAALRSPPFRAPLRQVGCRASEHQN